MIKHVYKNLFIPIIQYSDVGIDPEAEEEMEMNNEVEQEEDIALQVYQIYSLICLIILFLVRLQTSVRKTNQSRKS